MKWYGVTGGIASGKSTVTKLLRSDGVVVLDADQIVQRLMEPGGEGWTKVRNEFGADYFDAQNFYDRKKMAGLVFQNSKELARLESVLHPLVQAEVLAERRRLEDSGEPFALYDVPLLFEKNLKAQFDGVIVVSTDKETQVFRMSKDRGYSQEEVQRRLQAQLPLSEKVKAANYVVNNSGSLEDLTKEVKRLVVWLKAQNQRSDQSSKA
jgi:dephospho-CoA kinase